MSSDHQVMIGEEIRSGGELDRHIGPGGSVRRRLRPLAANCGCEFDRRVA